jgi:PAS domain S-box-containing protein
VVSGRLPCAADTPRVGSTAARVFLCVGALAIAGHFALAGDVTLYDSLGLASAGLIFFAVAAYRPRTSRAWITIGVSQLLMALGDFVYDNLTARYPGPADALYLSSVGLLILGVLLLSRESVSRNAAANLDALLVTLGLGIAAWLLIFTGPTDGTLLGRAVTVAYPAADLLLLGALVRLLFVQGRRTSSYWLLVASVLPLLVADGAWVLPSLDGTYAASWPDAGWLASYTLLAAAALHPSMERLVVTAPAGQLLSLRRGLTVGGSLVIAPLSLAIAELKGHHVNIVPVAVAGSVLLMLVVARFATIVRELDALRIRAEESERKFRMVFERAPIGISIGRDGIMSETNPALQRILGYTGAELARMHYTEVTHPDDLNLDAQAELDAGNRDAFVATKQYVRKDGSPVDTRVNVLLDLEDGLGMSLLEDVSARRVLEEQLRQAQKMEAVGKLAGGIAHDFNNLMTAVIGYSDLLLRRGDPAAQEKLEAIRASAVRASDLTRQLLAFSGRQLLQLDELDLRDAVRRFEPLLERTIGERNRLELDLGDEPVVVRADEAQLERVLVNLAANAREALPHAGVVTIAVRANDDVATLTVADDGIGMDEETEAHIFEPFFTTKGLGESPGLGLSTVHGIVGQSGGTVEVESTLTRGSVFTVRLPLAAAGATLVD